MSEEFDRIDVHRDGEVATVVKRRGDGSVGDSLDPTAGITHREIADAMEALRRDDEIRVIVLTGQGDVFSRPPDGIYESEAARAQRNDPRRLWSVFTGVLRAHQAMAECEKPIVARVNGDAIGFAMSLTFASDIIVAREDARLVDHHLGMGEVEGVDAGYGFTPGDGGAALVPLYLSPPLAKEFLMLAKPYTARELADMHAINYAVPAEELDERVTDVVEGLLRRSAYALAWTKRVANRHVIRQLNATLDAGAAYEMVNFLQAEWLDWTDPKRFTWDREEAMARTTWSGPYSPPEA